MNEDKNIMREDSVYIEGIRLIYPRLQKDIEEGKELEKNLRSIESCMNEMAEFISDSKRSGTL